VIGHESEVIITRKGGEQVPASISFSVAEVGERLYFTGIIRDLSRERALEERVNRTERLAVLGQTVAEISHEIKNPLMMIGGFARQLARKSRDEKDRAKLAIISREVERLERLLAGLRDLYRPQQLQLERLDVADLLHEVKGLMGEASERCGIGFELKVDSSPLLIRGDREKLKQVLINLVKNSLEALLPGGSAHLRGRAAGDKVVIEVADTGPGIPEEIKERVFLPFFTTKEEGTGLGLCLSKRIVEEHPGGSFELESAEGQGTVVTLTFDRVGLGPESDPKEAR